MFTHVELARPHILDKFLGHRAAEAVQRCDLDIVLRRYLVRHIGSLHRSRANLLQHEVVEEGKDGAPP